MRVEGQKLYARHPKFPDCLRPVANLTFVKQIEAKLAPINLY